MRYNIITNDNNRTIGADFSESEARGLLLDLGQLERYSVENEDGTGERSGAPAWLKALLEKEQP
jgi:hypothetical protein